MKGSREDIRVKIPTSDIFIHSIYIEAAHQIFYDPFLFYHKNKEVQQNKYHVKQIIDAAVDETIRQMLPFDDILQKYLADALNDNAEFGDGESDTTEGSVSDSDEESINNNDLPSDESDFEDDEPDPDKDRVKSFNLDGLKSQFIPDDDDNNEPGEPGLDDEEPPSEPIPHLSPFNASPPQPVQNQPPQQFYPQPPPAPQQQQAQQPPQQPPQQPQGQPPQPPQQHQGQPSQNGGYSFF